MQDARFKFYSDWIIFIDKTRQWRLTSFFIAIPCMYRGSGLQIYSEFDF